MPCSQALDSAGPWEAAHTTQHRSLSSLLPAPSDTLQLHVTCVGPVNSPCRVKPRRISACGSSCLVLGINRTGHFPVATNAIGFQGPQKDTILHLWLRIQSRVEEFAAKPRGARWDSSRHRSWNSVQTCLSRDDFIGKNER